MPSQSWKKSDTLVGDAPPPAGERGWNPVLEDRLAAMRAMLATMRPGSDAEALRALRTAFPETSLAERVAVMAGEARLDA